MWPAEGSDVWRLLPEQYQRITDPACNAIAANLRSFCTNTALADSKGNVVLQNAKPGTLGSLGLRTIEGPGRWENFVTLISKEHPRSGVEASDFSHGRSKYFQTIRPPAD